MTMTTTTYSVQMTDSETPASWILEAALDADDEVLGYAKT
jgi:hypothetical protein